MEFDIFCFCSFFFFSSRRRHTRCSRDWSSDVCSSDLTERPTIERAVTAIRTELKARLAELRAQNKLLEAQRLESRTNFDIDMLLEVGRCTGIENYSRHLTGRQPGERPAGLLDYFPADY